MATAGGDSANHDYINIDELLQDMAGNDGDGDGDEQGDLLGPEDAEIFGSPKWLENFKEMKQAAIDPLYKNCSKQWTSLRLSLQLLMLKSRHG